MKSSHNVGNIGKTAIETLSEDVINFENKGQYSQAFARLTSYWDSITKEPKTDNLTRSEIAELYLRCGSVAGYFGHQEKTPNSQEYARNLLTKARRIFEELLNYEKVAECENHLALSYWRKGEVKEMQVMINLALSHDISKNCKTRLHSLILSQTSDFEEKNYQKIISNYKSVVKIFQENAPPSFLGSWYINVAMSYELLGDCGNAIKLYKSARKYNKKAEHFLYFGITENNLSYLYLKELNFAEAYNCIDNAIRIFKQIGDKIREAFALDTKAQICLDDLEFEEGLELIDEAISILESSESYGNLFNAYQTKAKILFSLGDVSEAIYILNLAFNMGRAYISEDVAKTAFDDFAEHLNKSLLPFTLKDYEEATRGTPENYGTPKMRLILPEGIDKNSRFYSVRMRSNKLYFYGLVENSVAIVKPEKRYHSGDLLAIKEMLTGKVYCGIADLSEMYINIETPDSNEIETFETSEIKILGKIIGKGTPKQDNYENILIVEKIELNLEN